MILRQWPHVEKRGLDLNFGQKNQLEKNENIIIWFVLNLTLDVLPAVLDSRRLCVLRIEAGRRRSTWGKSCCIKSVGKIYSVYILKNLPGSSFAISAPSALAAVSFSSTNSTNEGAPWEAFFPYGNIFFSIFWEPATCFLALPQKRLPIGLFTRLLHFRLHPPPGRLKVLKSIKININWHYM